MDKFNLQTSVLRVCVDLAQDDKLTGRIFSQMLTAPLPFSDASQLLLQIDQLLDAHNYPQAFQRTRAFQDSRRPFPLAAKGPGAGLSAQEVAAAAGAAATVSVHVITRRNATWQGRIDWETGDPPVQFSSALEAMRLLTANMMRQP